MKVSITDDATMSRTRSDGGEAVVRVDAIAKMPALKPAVEIGGHKTAALG
jgi:hypothetical protein